MIAYMCYNHVESTPKGASHMQIVFLTALGVGGATLVGALL